MLPAASCSAAGWRTLQAGLRISPFLSYVEYQTPPTGITDTPCATTTSACLLVAAQQDAAPDGSQPKAWTGPLAVQHPDCESSGLSCRSAGGDAAPAQSLRPFATELVSSHPVWPPCVLTQCQCPHSASRNASPAECCPRGPTANPGPGPAAGGDAADDPRHAVCGRCSWTLCTLICGAGEGELWAALQAGCLCGRVGPCPTLILVAVGMTAGSAAACCL